MRIPKGIYCFCVFVCFTMSGEAIAQSHFSEMAPQWVPKPPWTPDPNEDDCERARQWILNERIESFLQKEDIEVMIEPSQAKVKYGLTTCTTPKNGRDGEWQVCWNPAIGEFDENFFCPMPKKIGFSRMFIQDGRISHVYKTIAIAGVHQSLGELYIKFAGKYGKPNEIYNPPKNPDAMTLTYYILHRGYPTELDVSFENFPDSYHVFYVMFKPMPVVWQWLKKCQQRERLPKSIDGAF